jgi:hypothetical protein
VYVVGYPHSGTTWLGRLLASCLNAEFIDLDATEPPLEHQKPGLPILKTHKSSVPNSNNKPVVYVVRDIRDILMSYYLDRVAPKVEKPKNATPNNIFLKTTSKLIDKLDIVKEEAVISALVQQHATDWSNHVRIWLARKPIAIVRYEDLLLVPDEVISSLTLRLNIKISSEVVRQAIDSCSSSCLSDEEYRDKDLPVILDSVASKQWQKKYLADRSQDLQQIAGEYLKILGYNL